MIAWEEQGAGPVVVLVHGLTEDRRVWDTVAPLLAEHLRCIRLDLRGHGESSDAGDWSALAMADDVATVIAEADLDEQPLVVGHSLGAVVASAYAGRASVRGVVNVDQPMRFGDFAAAVQPMSDVLRGPAFGEAILQAFGSLDAVPDGPRALLDELHRAARKDVVLGVWDLILSTPPPDLTALAEEMLRAIDVPYLAIHGQDPGPGYAEWLTGLLPSAVVEQWSGGHYPHLAELQRFADRVLTFERGLPAQPPAS
jgi:pimeloyl-ACP methyl ester carboxylesterase